MAKPSCDHPKDTHCIHSSERKNFRSCRLRWYWAHCEHLTPYAPIKPLEFGIAIHKAMETVFDPNTWGTMTMEEKLQKALIVFDEENDEQRRKFIAQPFSNDKYDDYLDRKHLAAGMLTNYIRDIHPYQDIWFKPVQVEVSFHVPLVDENGEEVQCESSPNCGQDHPNPAPCTLDGRLDALVEDLVNGGYYILDWKTAGTLLASDKHLYLDDQIATYTAALSERLDVDVKGFLYIELSKSYPEAPHELKRKTKGCMYSQSKTASTSYEIAKPFFKLYDTEAYKEGKYDEYLEFLKKNPKKFVQRFAIRQNPTKSENVLLNAAKEAREMTRKDLEIYPAPGKFNCASCSFYEPCLQKLDGEDYQDTLENEYVGAKVNDS